MGTGVGPEAAFDRHPAKGLKACSSMAERCLYMTEAGGSTPSAPIPSRPRRRRDIRHSGGGDVLTTLRGQHTLAAVVEPFRDDWRLGAIRPANLRICTG